MKRTTTTFNLATKHNAYHHIHNKCIVAYQLRARWQTLQQLRPKIRVIYPQPKPHTPDHDRGLNRPSEAIQFVHSRATIRRIVPEFLQLHGVHLNTIGALGLAVTYTP